MCDVCVMICTQVELQHIHAEYGIVSSTLQQVLGQQLDTTSQGRCVSVSVSALCFVCVCV